MGWPPGLLVHSHAMKTNHEDPIAEIIQSQQKEIGKYKWIESEKVGRDIGWECAALE
jgi:hypothetical protein